MRSFPSVSVVVLAFLVAVQAQTISNAETRIPLPDQTFTFSGNVRGYWFSAPTDFFFTGVEVAPEAGTGNQSIAIVRFNTAPPPIFPSVTNDFTVLFQTQNNPTVGNIALDHLAVSSGDFLGVYGTTNGVNSYGNGPSSSEIDGLPITLNRSGMQLPLNSNDIQDIWSETGGSISRVFFYYSLDPKPIEEGDSAPKITLKPVYELGQLFSSAIPMNRAVGQIATGLQSAGTRDFSSRLFRIRSRYVPEGGFRDRSASISSRSRSIAGSRFSQMEERLTGNTIIDMTAKPRRRATSGSGAESVSTLSGDGSIFAVDVPAGATQLPGVVAAGERWVVFGSADFGDVELDGLDGNPGVESTTRSSTLGFEYQLNEEFSIGAGWSHVWNDNEFGNGLGSADAEGDVAIVYGTFFKNNLWADLMYSFGDYDTELVRNTGAGTVVTAQPGVETHQTALNLGYNFGIDRGRIVHGPTLGATYTDGSLQGYTETGDPLRNTTFAPQDFSSLITTVGWQMNWKQESRIGILRPQLRLGYGRENLDQDETIEAIVPQLNNATFVSTQTDPGEGWLDFGAGVHLALSEDVSLLVDYNGQFFRENTQVHFGSVQLQVSF